MNYVISEEFFGWIIKIIICSIGVFYIVFSALLLKKSLFMSRALITNLDHVLNILAMINLVASVIITIAIFFIAPY